ncbi:membrane hypothetical protein [Cupriavidus taiwanensis]|nr:membrane hypothetical protein [Cupriavidus taiwanensis]
MLAMNGYVLLALAIVAEVIATSSLKASQGFTRLLPSVLVVTGYVAAFYLLMLVMRTVPVGIAYAIWSGAGIVLVSLIAVVLYRQVPDLHGDRADYCRGGGDPAVFEDECPLKGREKPGSVSSGTPDSPHCRALVDCRLSRRQAG